MSAIYRVPLRVCHALVYHMHTALLFTFSDMKTVMVPVSVFACATAPLHSPVRLLSGMFWIWLHQLLCNVSNQARSREEDIVNKPWRPIPSGRVTEEQTFVLRWIVVGICFGYSALYGQDVVLTTLGLFLTTFCHDELGFSSYHFTKSLCNFTGYVALEVGATKLMGFSRDLDAVSVAALATSGLLIFTTIQAQDFPDVEGDIALGRMTFPIWAPELARTATLIGMVAWSLFLSMFWDVGAASGALFIALGAFVGGRYYFLRSPVIDKRSYVLYNVWLTLAHILPNHARTGMLAF